ncbi:hypothetical protein AB8B21_25000 [Tardiphaga sp. 866_E4_N2_1]|uniref:hypothetical protein n=1 Tax=unclassified Tardiphaga TaxID=2631404 RepID=UPI003F294ED3
MTPLEQVDHRMRVLAARIHAPEELLPGYRHVDSGRALIEHDGHFHYSSSNAASDTTCGPPTI